MTVYTTLPWPIFHAGYLYSWNSGGAKEVVVENVSPGALRRRIIRYWHPLGCRALDLCKPPQGCEIQTVVYCSQNQFTLFGLDRGKLTTEGDDGSKGPKWVIPKLVSKLPVKA